MTPQPPTPDPERIMGTLRVDALTEKSGLSREFVRAMLFRYDWPNILEHLEWLRNPATTNEEIVSWLQSLADNQETPAETPAQPFRVVTRSGDRQQSIHGFDTLAEAVENVREQVGIPVAYVQQWEAGEWRVVLPVDYPELDAVE